MWVDVLMEELLLLARFKGVATDELDSFINARLNAVNLSKVSSSAVTAFSGGLRRRVTVAHVLLVGVRVCVSGAKPETSILIYKRKGYTHVAHAPLSRSVRTATPTISKNPDMANRRLRTSAA